MVTSDTKMWLWYSFLAFSLAQTVAGAADLVQNLGSIWFYTKHICTDTLRYVSDPLHKLAHLMEHNLDADGLEIRIAPGRNRTLWTARPIQNRGYVCEYAGERISDREVEARIRAWPQDDFGYILGYDNQLLGESYNIDASREDGRLCRLASHSWKRANVDAFPVRYRNETRIIFLTTRDVAAGEELFFDYGHWAMNENDLKLFPWLAE